MLLEENFWDQQQNIFQHKPHALHVSVKKTKKTFSISKTYYILIEDIISSKL